MAIEMRRNNQTEFRQKVYECGYELIRAKVDEKDVRSSVKGQVADLIVARDMDAIKRTYVPMKTEALFRKLAALDYRDPASVLSFINEYGFLEEGDYYYYYFFRTVVLEGTSRWLYWYEPLLDVQKEIYEMHVAVNLMDAIHRGNEYELAYLVDGIHTFIPEEYLPEPMRNNCNLRFQELLNVKLESPQEVAEYMRKKGYRPDPGVDYKSIAIEEFANRIHCRLQNSIDVFIDVKCKGSSPVLRMQPKSLLGAMYLQLAQDFTGERSYRKCANCDNWFEIGVGESANKATRIYCSDACKLKAYRRRKKANMNP